MGQPGKRLTLLNDKHGTEAAFNLPASSLITRDVFRRLRMRLCQGYGKNCRCGFSVTNVDGDRVYFSSNRPGYVAVTIIPQTRS